jgi:hypothetical protein
LCVGEVRLCAAPSGWVAPAAADKDSKKKKKKGGDGNAGEQQQQQQQADGGDKELDPEKAAKKVRGVRVWPGGGGHGDAVPSM